jgi:hypothetical protein
MPTKIVVTNKLRQGLPILVGNGNGKVVSRVLPAKGKLVLDEAQHSQDLVDKEARGFIRLDLLEG